jgi:hypothetical protein
MWTSAAATLHRPSVSLQDRAGRPSEGHITMSKGLTSLLACGVAGAVAIILGVTQAAPPDFCRDYAAAAVRQVQLARSNPACDRGTGARWTSDYRVHFDWCLGAAPGVVEAERAARTNWIRACRGR